MTDDHVARGAWADLIPLRGGERILFVGADRSGGAIRRLRARGADVDTTGNAARVKPGDWDVVVASHLPVSDVTEIQKDLTSTCVLVVVADNRFSPLAARTHRRTGWSHQQVTAVGGDVLALLRSADVCTTAFRLDLPRIATTVLAGAAVGAGRGRRLAITGLRHLALRGWAGPVVPAWLVVRGGSGSVAPTGRMGVAENDQGAVLYGSGPDSVEKTFSDPAELIAVRSALAQLDSAGLEVGGRILEQSSHERLRLEWVPGTVLDANNLPPDDLVRWTASAAELLGRIHAGTAHAGTVLVHGDFWLGAVVVENSHIRGVIDWTDSYRGDASRDIETLSAVARTRTDLSALQSEAVLDAVGEGYRTGFGSIIDR